MKTRVQIALFSTLLSVCLHLYLTLHYYPLKLGFSEGQSLCNLNAKFDCDAVAASAYSSLLGIPMSIWGAITNAVLFLLILLGWLEWTEHPERTRRWAVALSFISFSASVVMGLISATLLSNYCLVCIALYVLSAATFFAYRPVLREPFFMHIQRDLPKMWSESRALLLTWISIPVLALVMHQMFMQNFGSAELGRHIEQSIRDWETAPRHELVAKPALAIGPSREAASVTLSEFADFRCGHCKRASYSLDAFVKSHPDVRFEFYSFPLDGECNEKIEHKTGISCRLAYAVTCAEKDGKGWEMHHALFDHQEEINRSQSSAELDVILSREVALLGLNWPSLQLCLNDPATQDQVRAQAKQGALVNVRGTPTILANGRMLGGGQLIPVLARVHELSLHKNGK